MKHTQLILSPYAPNEWVLVKPFVVRSDRWGVTLVPRGFITDLASIPKPLRAVINVNGQHRYAAVLHDYLYCRGLDPDSKIKCRADADRCFLDMMLATGVHKATAYLMYTGVRAGGWLYWNKRRSKTMDEDFVPLDYFERSEHVFHDGS